MIILVSLFVIESFFLIIMNNTVVWKQWISDDGEKHYIKRNSKFLVCLFAIFIIIVVGLRNKFWDTSDYRNMYMLIGTNINNVFDETVPRIEKGYLLFTFFLNLISRNSQFLLIVCSIITNGLFVATIYKESEDVPLSLFLFLCTGYLSTMNGMRQILAGAIIFYVGTKWSKKRDQKADIKMLLCIIVMATFHKSALICIPLFLMARGRRFSRWIKGFLLLSIILFIVPGLSTLVINILGGSEYSDYQSVSATQGIIRFFVNSVPFTLCLLCAAKCDLDNIADGSFNWMFNLSVIGFGFNLLALRMVYYARINMFFCISDMIMLPKYIDLLFNRRNSKIIKFLAVVCYTYFYYTSLLANGNFVKEFALMF